MSDDFDPFEREFLHRACRLAAGVDLVVCGASRVHHFESGRKIQVFRYDDLSGDSIAVLFAPEGMVITGVDHESPLSPYNHDSPHCRSKVTASGREVLLPRAGIFDDVPDALMRRVKRRPDGRWRTVTFCYWYDEHDGEDEWWNGKVQKDDDEDDGSGLLANLPRDAERLVEHFEDYLEKSWPKSRVAAVEEVFELGTITDEHIEALAPGAKKKRASYTRLKKQLAKLGLR